MEPNKIVKVGVVGWLIGVVVWLSVVGGIAYTVIHFVRKFW